MFKYWIFFLSLWYISTRECCPSIKRNNLLICTIWMKLHYTTPLSERSQTQWLHNVWFYVYDILEKAKPSRGSVHMKRRQIRGYQELDVRGVDWIESRMRTFNGVMGMLYSLSKCCYVTVYTCKNHTELQQGMFYCV